MYVTFLYRVLSHQALSYIFDYKHRHIHRHSHAHQQYGLSDRHNARVKQVQAKTHVWKCQQAPDFHLDDCAGENGEALLCGQHPDEAQDEEVQGEPLQGGEECDLVRHAVGLAVHSRHAV